MRPSTLPASAALARPAPIDAATSATETACSNCRWLPSGRVMLIMMGFPKLLWPCPSAEWAGKSQTTKKAPSAFREGGSTIRVQVGEAIVAMSHTRLPVTRAPPSFHCRPKRTVEPAPAQECVLRRHKKIPRHDRGKHARIRGDPGRQSSRDPQCHPLLCADDVRPIVEVVAVVVGQD